MLWLKRRICDFLIGIVWFFVPFVAIALFIIMSIPYLLSLLSGAWFMILCVFWLYDPQAWIKQPLIQTGIATPLFFAFGYMVQAMLWDAVVWLWRPHKQVEASLAMSLANDSSLPRERIAPWSRSWS